MNPEKIINHLVMVSLVLVIFLGSLIVIHAALDVMFKDPVVVEGPDPLHRAWEDDCDARHGSYTDTEPALCVGDDSKIIVTYREGK